MGKGTPKENDRLFLNMMSTNAELFHLNIYYIQEFYLPDLVKGTQ